MRLCWKCKTADREVPQPGVANEHFVVPEIRYLDGKTQWNESLRRYGWVPRKFQGRNAMERFSCRPCIVSESMRDAVWSDMRQAALKLEKQPDENAEYYRLLCE